jgi:hypothetical protein
MESWRNRKTLILSRTDMTGLVTPAEYVSCVEQAYRMHGEGRYYMDPNGMDRPRSRPLRRSWCAGGLLREGAPPCLAPPPFTQ